MTDTPPIAPATPRPRWDRPRARTTPWGYILRHWRGELPLPVSYWVNGALINVSVGLVSLLLLGLDITTAPRLVLTAFILLTVFALVCSIWQLVGIWRSAGKVIGGRRASFTDEMWAWIARVAIMFGVANLVVNTVFFTGPRTAAQLQIVLGHDPIPPHVVRVVNKGREIEYVGGIGFGATATLKAVLDANPETRIIDLDSQGGRLAEAQKMLALIKERRLATYTDGLCASACTMAYMGGVQRYLGPDGVLGFHRGSFPGTTAAQDVANAASAANIYRAEGVSDAFIRRAMETPAKSLWRPDSATLVYSGVVTQLVDGSAFAPPSDGRPITAQSVDAKFTRVPVIAAFKRRDPQAYGRALTAAADAWRAGEPMGVVTGAIQGPLRVDMQRLRPLASDAYQVNLARTLADEGRALAWVDPDLCLSLLLRPNPRLPNYIIYLPSDLRARDAALGVQLFDDRPDRALPVASKAEAVDTIMALRTRLQRQGALLNAANVAYMPPFQRRALCLGLAAVNESLGQMPPSRVGALMRYFARASVAGG